LSALLRQLREEQVVKSEKGKGGVTLFSLVWFPEGAKAPFPLNTREEKENES
jgi:hypothetical protein